MYIWNYYYIKCLQLKPQVMMIINYVNYYLTRWTFFFQLIHTADDGKEKHVSQV